MPEPFHDPSKITFRTCKTRRVSIRIHPDCQIIVTAPHGYPREKLDTLLRKKERWIAATVARMREIERNRPRLNPGELRYRGETYRFVHEPGRGRDTVVDEATRVIRSAANLMMPEVRNTWLIEEARALIAVELARYEKLGYRWKRVTIRSQRTRWGSCSAKGTLSFNRLLAEMPPLILSYIVAHEVAHTRHLNHSPAFYRELDSIFPERKEAEQWLRGNGAHYLTR